MKQYLAVFFQPGYDFIHDGRGYPVGEQELAWIADLYHKTKDLIGNQKELARITAQVDAEHRQYSKEIEEARKERVARPTFVYLAKDTVRGFVKIGYTKNVKGRIGQLKIANPGLEYLAHFDGSIEDEQFLHGHFKRLGKRIDSEWFSLDDSDLRDIETYFNNQKRA